jgi:hypothetical protein
MGTRDTMTINTTFGVSKEPEVGQVMYTAAADFEGVETTAFNVVIPNIEKVIRKGKIGSGTPFAKQGEIDNGYITHPSWTFADAMSTSSFAKLVARFMGGNITSTEVGASSGVYDHVIELMVGDDDDVLPASTIAAKMGGIDFILGGMVGTDLSVTYQDGATPQVSLGQAGTGLYDFMGDQTPALVLPKAASQNYMGGTGAHCKASMNDGTLFDVSSLGILAAYSINASNDVVLNDRRSGDQLLEANNYEGGAYSYPLTRGSNYSFGFSMTIFVANNRRALTAHLGNVELTDIRFKQLGRKIGAGTYRHEVEFIVPMATMTTAQTQDRNGKVILECAFEPQLKNGEANVWKLRIRNTSPTLA